MNRPEGFLAYLIDLIDALAGWPRQSRPPRCAGGVLVVERDEAPTETWDPDEAGDGGSESGEVA